MIKRLLYGFVVLTLGACASAPSKTGKADSRELFVPWNEIYAQGLTDISFPFDITVADDFTVEDATDAKSLVLFALKLERKQKFTEAATFFHEAAALQEKSSSAGHFRLSCLGAAAVCWLKAGEEKEFQGTVASIREDLNRFQQADLPEQLSLLLAISDKLKGKSPQLNPSLPQAVKTLFDSPRRTP